MIHKDIINILLLNVSDSDTEQLVGGFRQSGRLCREVRISTSEQLGKQLAEQRWDLLLFDSERAQVDIKLCGNLLRKHNCDIPLIYLSDDDPLSPPDPAVSATFTKYDFPRLVSAALREIAALNNRREIARLTSALAVAEQRSQLLMQESKDAVAYVTGGMIIHANPVFCSNLGHDDLTGYPLVDLIDSGDQDRLKNALKQQQLGQDERQVELSFVHADGSRFNSHAVFSNTEYEDEACTQLLLSAPEKAAAVNGVDAATGLPGRPHFLELLQEFIEGQRNSNSSLILLSTDNYLKLRAKLGLNLFDQLIGNIADKAQQAFNPDFCGRISDDIIALVARGTAAQDSLETCRALLTSVEDAIFEIDRLSAQCTLSAAVIPINHLTPPDANKLLTSSYRFLEKVLDSGGNQAQIFQKDRQALDLNESAGKLVSEALSDQRLQLLFEPMVNLGSASGDHYEVTLELKEQAEGEISAGELMRNIEQEPENNQLDRWIVIEATKTLAKERLSGQDIKLIINLTANVFHDDEFCSWLSVAIKAAGLPASALTLQFREESIAQNLRRAADFCNQLRNMGGEFGVSNFGRDQSDKLFGHIQPDLVKPGLRRSDEIINEQVQQFIRSARGLGSRIVIPNVSSAATLAMLWQLGPDFIQGSYVQDPVPSMSYEFSAFG